MTFSGLGGAAGEPRIAWRIGNRLANRGLPLDGALAVVSVEQGVMNGW